jgi:F420-0:gamma-glutamyl ligase-like protein
VTGPPRANLDAGQEWPSSKIAPGTPNAVARAVSVASAVSVALAEALDGRSIAEVARTADVARSTIYDLLSGSTWPDLVTVSKLEDSLETSLWPTA